MLSLRRHWLLGNVLWLPHPIYAGFVAMCAGVSMIAASAAGLWLVTPTVLLACTGLVLGYERLDLKRRFGDTPHLLPADDTTPPSSWDRIRFLLVVVVPWIALYEFTVHMGVLGFAFRLPFEDHLPIYSWTVLIYQSCYVTVALAPWCARTQRDLRQLMISPGWLRRWSSPSTGSSRPARRVRWWPAILPCRLLDLERTAYPPPRRFPLSTFSGPSSWRVCIGRAGWAPHMPRRWR